MSGIKSSWDYGLTRLHVLILTFFAKVFRLDKNKSLLKQKTEEK